MKAIVTNYPALNTEFETITKQLEDYYTQSFDKIKDIRDLTVHYDRDPVKFYNMIQSLEVEESFKKLTGFVRIITAIYALSSKIMVEISNDSKSKRNDYFDEQINKIEALKSVMLNRNSESDASFDGIIDMIKKLQSK